MTKETFKVGDHVWAGSRLAVVLRLDSDNAYLLAISASCYADESCKRWGITLWTKEGLSPFPALHLKSVPKIGYKPNAVGAYTKIIVVEKCSVGWWVAVPHPDATGFDLQLWSHKKMENVEFVTAQEARKKEKKEEEKQEELKKEEVKKEELKKEEVKEEEKQEELKKEEVKKEEVKEEELKKKPLVEFYDPSSAMHVGVYSNCVKICEIFDWSMPTRLQNSTFHDVSTGTTIKFCKTDVMITKTYVEVGKSDKE